MNLESWKVSLHFIIQSNQVMWNTVSQIHHCVMSKVSFYSSFSFFVLKPNWTVICIKMDDTKRGIEVWNWTAQTFFSVRVNGPRILKGERNVYFYLERPSSFDPWGWLLFSFRDRLLSFFKNVHICSHAEICSKGVFRPCTFSLSFSPLSSFSSVRFWNQR